MDIRQIATCTVAVLERPVRYKVVGEGAPVVLVHGLSGSSLWWKRNIPALAASYRLYLVDLPGFGSMASPFARFELQDASAWLFCWMQAVGITHAHLIGHSMGGYICLQVAARHPAAVSRLVLVSPAIRAQARHVFGYVRPLLRTVRYLDPYFLPILLYDTLRAGPVTILRAVNELLSVEARQELHAVTAPTLLVWGAHDTLVPPSTGSVMLREMPRARLLQLARGGHVSMFEQAEQFNQAVLTFLAGNTPTQEQTCVPVSPALPLRYR
ncbi:MAG TPA: alpha/beta fold hydrolase [Ktedonobacteraceae bacterium]|jgi:pimeloyl-ACP methyl ester carboxylesterase